ncbi:MAG: hypothetical protein JW703_05495 [Candidatus Diapherotrites archaeon]|nr:hypothetical protein [Candidatus Diapherotrites archaeon]
MDEINYADFAKLDIRIGKVIEAEDIDGSNKLIKLLIDFGEFKKTVFAGIKGLIELDEIKGKQIPVLVNIAPKKTPFGFSEGMILAASEETSEGLKLALLFPSKELKAGSKVE